MKSIRALNLLKKYKLVHKDMRLRDLKFYRRIFEDKSWEDFIRNRMMAEYLVGKRDLSKAITIPEVNMSVGGTLNLETGKLE